MAVTVLLAIGGVSRGRAKLLMLAEIPFSQRLKCFEVTAPFPIFRYPFDIRFICLDIHLLSLFLDYSDSGNGTGMRTTLALVFNK